MAIAANKIHKICFFLYGIHGVAINAEDAAGGAERQVWLLAQELAARGFEVICCDYQTPEFEPEIINQVHFFHAGPRHYVTALIYCQKHLGFDLAYFRGANHSLGPAAAYLKLKGVPSIYGIAFDDDCISRRALTHRSYLWPGYALGLSQVWRIFVQHPGQLRMLPRRLREKAYHVPSIAGEVAAERQPMGGYVAWIGMLRAPKRPDRLINLARLCPDLHFVVAGGITTHRTPRQYGEEILGQLLRLPNVDYRGLVSPDEAEALMARASILLSTSEREGFPNVFLQAWRHHVPVASWEIDPGGILVEHDIGMVVPNLEKMAHTLREFVSQVEKNRAMGARGAAYVEQHHSARVAAESFIGSIS